MDHGIAYRPQVDLERFGAFGQCLSRCPGSWTHIRSSFHGNDPKTLCLSFLIPGAPWCDVPGYLAFLDSRPHRQLLRCFVSQSPKQSWSLSELVQLLGPALSPTDLEAALAFCTRQEFLVEDGGTWQPGPRMYQVRNLGATLEWAVMEHLQHFHQANARRGVLLKELQEQGLGDLDVLAFTESGLTVTVECKSSTSGISDQHMTRFLRRAALFPADIALFLIDTSDEQQLTSRLAQLVQCLGSGMQHQDLPMCYTEARSQVYHVQENIYLGHTGGGIGATLKAVIQAGALRKHQ